MLLVDELVSGGADQGSALLAGAAQVWLTNVIVFALAYWELDRGGPVAAPSSPRPELPPADFRFPQDEDHDAIDEVAARSVGRSGWTPGFIDYLYVSVTNSSAFSPTDTMPLSHRAKMLMARGVGLGADALGDRDRPRGQPAEVGLRSPSVAHCVEWRVVVASRH